MSTFVELHLKPLSWNVVSLITLQVIIQYDGCSLIACGRCHLAFGRWGRLMGLFDNCIKRHAFGCIPDPYGRAWYLSILQRWYLHLSKLSYLCLDNACLDQFPVICIEICELMAWNLIYLGPSLCVTCMYAFTALRQEPVSIMTFWRHVSIEM